MTLTFDDILLAAKTIGSTVHRTPVVTCETLDKRCQARFFFKCENLQKVGAFKFRGACNAVFQLDEESAQKGVVTHSSGNHAQALALAAKKRGIEARIVMPDNAPTVKREGVVGYGGTVIDCAANLQARETTANRVEQETGATFIHPYDHPLVIAGQGTAALELLQDAGELDAVIAPVGGGGLISGTCVAVAGQSCRTRVIGAEPAGADDAARSKAANRLVPQTNPNTIADGLLTSLGEWTWPYVRDAVSEIVTATEGEIIEAMKFFWSRTKLLIEPSSAVAVAVALKTAWPAGSRVGIILSGGNVDLDRLPWTGQSA